MCGISAIQLFAFLSLLGKPEELRAQGTITGRITNEETKKPLISTDATALTISSAAATDL